MFSGAPAPETTKFLATPSDEENKNVLTCSLCENFVNDIYELLRNETITDEQIIQYVVDVCVTLDIFANPEQVCGGTALILLVRNA